MLTRRKTVVGTCLKVSFGKQSVDHEGLKLQEASPGTWGTDCSVCLRFLESECFLSFTSETQAQADVAVAWK